jgi:hypothetical protein
MALRVCAGTRVALRALGYRAWCLVLREKSVVLLVLVIAVLCGGFLAFIIAEVT